MPRSPVYCATGSDNNTVSFGGTPIVLWKVGYSRLSPDSVSYPDKHMHGQHARKVI